MARYDGWGQRGGVGNYREPGPATGGYGWARRAAGAAGWSRRPGYDAGFVQEGPRSGPDAWEGYAPRERGSGVYGPARYGLGPYYQRLLDRRRPDDELKEEVEEALFYDSWVDAEAITVDVQDGIVTLRGQLPNYEEIRYAIDDAWDVDGVRGVRGDLTIREPSE